MRASQTCHDVAPIEGESRTIEGVPCVYIVNETLAQIEALPVRS